MSCPIRKRLTCTEYISFYPANGPIGPTGSVGPIGLTGPTGPGFTGPIGPIGPTGPAFEFVVEAISGGITQTPITINNNDRLRFISNSIGLSLFPGSANLELEFTKFNSGATGPTSPGVTINDVYADTSTSTFYYWSGTTWIPFPLFISCDVNSNLLAGDAVASAGATSNTVYGCGSGSGSTLVNSFVSYFGYQAGFINGGTAAVAVGNQAGYQSQGGFAIAIGNQAGFTGQGTEAIAIGPNAAFTSQGANAIAISSFAGNTNQGANGIAIGANAANSNQGLFGIGIGFNAAGISQGQAAIAIGVGAASFNQQANAIAIGNNSSGLTQGANAISIGASATFVNQFPNSIIINSTGIPVTIGNSGCFISPIRANGNTLLATMQYDSTTKELFASTTKTFVIDHPTDKNKYLVHGCVEGPESAVFYRGEDCIPIGSTRQKVTLPHYVSSFAYNFSIQITPIIEDEIRVLNVSRVTDNSFEVYGKPGSFYWIVYGKRGDIEVEVDKSEYTIQGDGPYTYLTKN